MVPLRLRRFPIAGKKYIAPFLLCFCLFALPTFLLAQDEQAAPGTRMTRLTTRHILISPSEAEGLLLQKTAPVYPPAAKAAHVSGTVVMHAVISKTGIVEDIHVVGGPQLLQQAAMDAVKNWIYRPYMQNGKAENVITTVNLVFALEERPAAPPAAAPDEAERTSCPRGSLRATMEGPRPTGSSI